MPRDLFATTPEPLVLHDYQLGALASARENIRRGNRRQILCAPTGAGKTIIALGLMQRAEQVGSRSAFITDRSALIDQTSLAMDRYGIDHGIMQAEHWRCRPSAPVQLVSAQTLGRRLGKGGYVEHHLRDLRFVLIDECFVGETQIATPAGPRAIRDLAAGDSVISAIGPTTIRSVFEGSATTLVTLRLSNGQHVRCTADHPIFTDEGWREAGTLGVGARLYCEQAVRSLWQAGAPIPMGQVAVLGDGDGLRQAAFLRQVLRQEIEEPDDGGRRAGTDGCDPETYWAWSSSAGRERATDAGGTSEIAGISGGGLAAGACGSYRAEANRRLPLSLQDRRGEPDSEGCRRDRRRQPRLSREAGAGPEEGGFPSPIRVEAVETQELGSAVPVYNLRVNGHPSYFAGGVLVHNCHTLYRSTLDWLATLPEHVAIIGLTATPFTRGLGKHFQACVNVATTDGLVGTGMLVRPIFYTAVEADVSGVATRSTGEWDDHGLEAEGIKIVGDVVTEYTKRTTDHFGGPVKTIAFSSTVAHGEEICRAFAGIGLNFQNISYRDDEDERRAKIEEFRKPDSAITGLVSCDALAKGFDVPDVRVCILCRPLRKSLTTHIQQIGRVMRSFPGKDQALVIDHSGNALRFLIDTIDFWANGVDELNEAAEKDKVARPAKPKDRKEMVCFGCQAVLPPGVSACLACGRERPRRSSDITIVNGSTQRLELAKQSSRRFDFDNHPLLRDPGVAYQSFLAWATERKRGDEAAGRKWAAGIFKGVYGCWPPGRYDSLPLQPDLVTFEVESFCKREMARYSKSRAAA